ncbi:hypothetical protein KIPB_008285, partial [Kipferlia bialata]
ALNPFSADGNDIGSRTANDARLVASLSAEQSKGRCITATAIIAEAGASVSNAKILAAVGDGRDFSGLWESSDFAQLGYALLWSTNQTMRPEAVFEAPSALTCLSVAPGCPQGCIVFVAGGTDGEVCLYVHGNVSALPSNAASLPLSLPVTAPSTSGGGSQETVSLPVAVSPATVGHRREVTSVHWLSDPVLPDGTASEAVPWPGQFVTSSSDGTVSVWSTEIDDAPVLRAGESPSCSYLRRVLTLGCVRPTTLRSMHGTKVASLGQGGLLVGTETGDVGVIDIVRAAAASHQNTAMQGRRLAEYEEQVARGGEVHNSALGISENFDRSTLQSVISAHRGYVLCMEHSPAMPSLLVTAAASGFKVWLQHMGSARQARKSAITGLLAEQDVLAYHDKASAALQLARIDDTETLGSLSSAAHPPELPEETRHLLTDPLILFETPYFPVSDCLSACAVSPTRPSVVIVGTSTGTVQIWDIGDRRTGPIVQRRVSVSPIVSISASKGRRGTDMVTVGDAQGGVHVLRIPRGRRSRERQYLRTLFARETAARHYNQWRREIKTSNK